MARKIPPRRVPRDRFVQKTASSGGLFGGRSIPGAHTHVEADITDLDKYSQAAADAKFVEVGGDTMTGLLVLSGDPSANLGAATKQFVDNHNWLEADITDLQAYLLDITGEALGTLSDVTITAIASGEILKWTGSAFINNTLAEAGISATGHTHVENDITDLGPYVLAAGGTFTGAVIAEDNQAFRARGTAPEILLEETDATVDEGTWGFRASADTLALRLINDAFSSAANWLTVERTGIGIDSINVFGGFRVNSGKHLRVQDSGNTDWGVWTHDGTDFNLTLVNTTDYNITGLTNLNVGGTAVSLAGHTHLEADITDLQAYLVSPLTTDGDVLFFNSGHQRLAKGANGEVLTLAAGVPTWAAAAGGYTDPLTTDGDILIRDTTTKRLAKGTDDQVLTLASGLPVWAAAAGGVTDHGALTGLGDDDHTQYALLAGDTFTGDVTIEKAVPRLFMKVTDNSTAGFIFQDGAVDRYSMGYRDVDNTFHLNILGSIDGRSDFVMENTGRVAFAQTPVVTGTDVSLDGHTHLEGDITDLQAYLLDITGEALSTLGDVTITSIATGEILKWSGSAWVNNTLAEAGISATGHTHVENDITDLGTYLPLTAGTSERLTGYLYIESADPRIRMIESDAAADNRLWDFIVNGTEFRFQCRADDEATATNFMVVQRSGNLATKINFFCTDLQHNSVDVALEKMTTNGDILYYNSGRQRLAKGSDDEVLTLVSGIPSWEAGGGGITVTVSTSAASGGGNDGDLWCRI